MREKWYAFARLQLDEYIIENLQRFEDSGWGQGCFMFHNQKMYGTVNSKPRKRGNNTDKRNGRQKSVLKKREQCGCCGQASEGRPTGSKCKAFSFVWNSSRTSPQRASPSEAGRNMGTPLADRWTKPSTCACCAWPTQPFWASWTQRCDGCDHRRYGTWVPYYGNPSKRRNKAWLGPNDQIQQLYKPGFQIRKDRKSKSCPIHHAVPALHRATSGSFLSWKTN